MKNSPVEKTLSQIWKNGRGDSIKGRTEDEPEVGYPRILLNDNKESKRQRKNKKYIPIPT